VNISNPGLESQEKRRNCQDGQDDKAHHRETTTAAATSPASSGETHLTHLCLLMLHRCLPFKFDFTVLYADCDI